MINEIKDRLERGEVVELECVDREGFLKDINRRGANDKILDQGLLMVDYIDSDGDISLVGGIGDIYRNVIVSEEFKYFRIKFASYNKDDIANHTHKGVTSGVDTTKPSDGATFDDLIDVAVQAVKDRVLSGVELERDGVESLRYWTDKRSDCNVIFAQHNNYQDGIDFINSLYTETFVIESEEDMCKFNNDIDSIILANGEDIIDIVMFNRNEPYFTNGGASAVKVPFELLKGAAVTQKRDK